MCESNQRPGAFRAAAVSLIGAISLLAGCAVGTHQIRTEAEKAFGVEAGNVDILARREVKLRWSGERATVVKLVDVVDGKGYRLALRPDGSRVEFAALAAADREAFTKRFGKLEPELFERLRAAGEGERFKVGVWLRDTPRVVKATDRRRATGKLVALRAERQQAFQSAAAANTRRLEAFSATLKRPGVEVMHRAESAPLVLLESDAAGIEAIAKDEAVEFVYLARVGRDLLNTAIPSVAGSAWPTTQFEGNGVRIAIVEDDGIDFANPFLADADGGAYQADNTNLAHPTRTAGVAASRHPVYRGMAPQATLLSGVGGSYDAADIIDATDWALGTGNADVVNCSFGFDTGDARYDLMARYYNHVVWREWRVVTPAAGNDGAGSNVLSPGVGYNVLTVGGIDDADTPWDADDGIYAGTSGGDPPSTHGDREKPEVSAVATGILTTNDTNSFNASGQWIIPPGGGREGTSYAAPAVAGAVARLIDRKNFLYAWPEELKAIIMASAVRRAFDATVDTDNDTVDVREGVGTVVVPLAEKIVSQDWHHGLHVTGTSVPYNHFFDAEVGDVIRFVVVWNAHTDAAYTSVALEADLDLHMYDPSGNRVAYSVSWDNPYEIVEFTAPETGTYRARVRDWRFDGSYEWVGLAWSRR